MFQSLILPGISFGLTATSIPGPLQAYIINTALAQGWRRAIILIFSPLVVDAPIIVLVLFILGQTPAALIPLIQIVGGLFLFWLAWGAWQGYRAGAYIGKSDADDPELTPPQSTRALFARGLLLNVLSPGPYLFWGTVNGRLLLEGLEQSVWHGLAFLIAFYGTFLGGLATLVFIFSRVGQLDPRISRRIMLLTIGLMVFFAASFVISGVGALLNGT